MLSKQLKYEVLYVLGAEKAQGAEIVIERLIDANHSQVNAHLMLAPGSFANQLLAASKPYPLTIVPHLKKLNRKQSSKIAFLATAIKNHFSISYRVYQYVKSENIKIVHANTIVCAAYLLPLVLAAKILLPKVKFIWSDHDMMYYAKTESFLAGLCSRVYDLTLAVSKAVATKYTSKKVEVLYNGLTIDKFKIEPTLRHSFRTQLGLKEDTIIIGMVANICEGKGQIPVIRVFKNLISERQVYLLLAGLPGDDEDYNDDFRSEIADQARVIYLGHCGDMVKFYNGCDIVVNNSNKKRSEALGTAIYEAMGCGNIVIAANTGGTPEIITDGVDGILFTADSEPALAKELNKCISNIDELANMRINARAKVLQKFEMSIMTQNYNQLLARLV